MRPLFFRRDGSLPMFVGLSMNYDGVCDLGYDGISKICALSASVVRDIIDEKGIQPEAKVNQQHANLQAQMDDVKKMPGPQGVTRPKGDGGRRGETICLSNLTCHCGISVWADVSLLPGSTGPAATLGRTAGDGTLQVAIMYLAETNMKQFS